MKNVIKLFAGFLIVGLFVASCGGDCETCTMEGQDDKEFCDSDYDADSLYTKAISDAEALGYTCE